MILGIDPGLDGALVLTDGTAVEVLDVPTLTAGKGREVDGLAVAHWLDERSLQIRAAFLERVNAMPAAAGPNGKRRTMGAQSAFTFGRTDGLLHGLVVANLISTTRVTPVTWQKAMAVPKGKDGARARAKELLPAHAHLFDRKRDDGRADAALLALYGLRQLGAVATQSEQKEVADV
jgi:crossover junction endodeoxyribonuclease RuvC